MCIASVQKSILIALFRTIYNTILHCPLPIELHCVLVAFIYHDIQIQQNISAPGQGSALPHGVL